MEAVLFIVGFIFPCCLLYFVLNCASNQKLNKLEKQFINKFLTEANMEVLFKRLILNHKHDFLSFQLIRVKTTMLLIIIMVTYCLLHKIEISYEVIGISALVIIIIYKFFYISLVFLWNAQIEKANKEFPYYIKTIAILIGVKKNVQNAIDSSIRYCPDIFKESIQILAYEMHKYPNNVDVFEKFIDKYKGVKELEPFMKLLYRLCMSNDGNEYIVESLTNRASVLVEQIRREKNRKINESISYLGLIPVFILGVAFTMLLGFTI